MKDWDDLQTVLALGRAGTMKGAANALGVSETTISRRIQKIAQGDVAVLFARDGHRWLPTKVGERLMEVAEGIEKQVFEADAIFDERNELLSGELRISSISFINTHFMGPALLDFARQNPSLSISLEATDDRVSLAFREADVAFRLARPTEGRLIGKRIALVPMAPVALDGTSPRKWVALPSSLDWTPEMQLGRRFFGKAPDMRVDSFEGVLQIMKNGEHGGVVPTCMMRRSNMPFAVLGPSVDRELWITYHEDLRNSLKVRSLIDWLAQLIPHANRPLGDQCP